MDIHDIMDRLDGKYKIVNIDSYDKVEDLGRKELPKEKFDEYIGKAIYVYSYKDGLCELIVPMAKNDSNFIVAVVDSDKYVDVYKLDTESHTFKFNYTGDPYETLYDEDELNEFTEDGKNIHPAPNEFNEGDIIFIAKHNSKDPYINDSLVDPTGVYLIGTGPMSYIDDDEDDLELLPVYGYMCFFTETKDKMESMVDFINAMIKDKSVSE